MNKNKKIIMFFVILVTVFIILSPKTYSSKSVTSTIYIYQKLSENNNQEFEYNITTPKEETTKITIAGNEKKEVTFTYDKPGIYEYNISLNTDNISSDWNYTEKTYIVKIYVSENSDDELISVVTVYNEEGLKSEEMLFNFEKNAEKNNTNISNNTNSSSNTNKSSTNNSFSANSNLPITGDNIVFYLLMLIISTLCIVILVIVKRRTKNYEKYKKNEK